VEDISPKGGKNMNKYEILYIIRAGIEDDQKNAVVEKYEALANSLGTVIDLDKWGIRKFAYVMDKQTEGYYVLMNVECSVEARDEIDRQMGIDDNVMRSMFIKK
jgi:small subunit ribosomal protein S6